MQARFWVTMTLMAHLLLWVIAAAVCHCLIAYNWRPSFCHLPFGLGESPEQPVLRLQCRS